MQKTDMESQKPILIPQSRDAGRLESTPTPPASQPTSIQVPHHLRLHGSSSPGSREHLFIQYVLNQYA